MPYICPSERAKYDPLIETLSESVSAEAVDTGNELNSAGGLNYICTRLILSVFRTLFGNLRYWHLALITGILENVKQEIYRKVGSPYENKKCLLNGEIPEFEEYDLRSQFATSSGGHNR